MNVFIRLCGVLFVLTLAASFGCGKKGWPEPQGERDAFAFSSVKFERDNDCLLLTAVFQGKAENLDHFVLFVEEDGCATCPFQPGTRLNIPLSDQRVRMLGNTVRISYCGFAEEAGLRFRLLGVNAMENLPPADSGVLQ